MGDAITTGRRAYEQRAWADAYAALCQASEAGPLAADDVERLARSAGLTGHEEAAIDAFARLHQLRLDAGDPLAAAMAAVWAAMRLSSLGEMARAGGWLATAQRLVDREDVDCVQRGWLELPLAFRATASGDFAAARAAAVRAAEIGERFGDRDLRALGRSFEGRAAIRAGRIAEGLALLDEAMVDVTGGVLSPVVTGVIYCGVIAACQHTYALERAREWTAALNRWCEAQPQLVAFAGACMVHRSEIMQMGGAWPQALEEARRASARLASTKDLEAGNAHYQEGELHRLRGALDEAERAYGLASDRGRDPQPGLALLRLAQGRVELAVAAMRRLLSVTSTPIQRARFLPACVDIMLAAAELAEARHAADELGRFARESGMEVLEAMAAHANGAVKLAEGDARGALAQLVHARSAWQHIGAPYLAARIRVVVAAAFRALGDEDGAALELAAARKVFVELGAADLATIEPAPARGGHGLSARELEVLRLVASGKTNKLIARELGLSEKTIDRHVSNIFAKLDVPTRAAATAWAYQHGLVG